ncbi:unnamed protein product [Mytilus edulis]|uniref:PiggyBac transposable element-derived protein 4 C-terminal zinc-ribbon domain-containing protein n=1 Tax=Mytilus edulis TaxID=6550 RepID=A0A8S3UR68_MYTED|nr:unnamed protein product [Mytilus edulis]
MSGPDRQSPDGTRNQQMRTVRLEHRQLGRITERHFPERIPDGKRKKCLVCAGTDRLKKSRIMWWCGTCKVGLCVGRCFNACFIDFKRAFDTLIHPGIERMTDASDDNMNNDSNNENPESMTKRGIVEDAGEEEECNQPATEPRRKRSTSIPVTRGRVDRLACPSGYKPVSNEDRRP